MWWFYWIVMPAAWVVWHLVFRIRVIGRENLVRGRGFILAPNHLCGIDPVFVIISRFFGPPMVILAKDELFGKNIFLDWFWKHVGMICVRRGKGDTAMLEEVVAEVRGGRGALIFPEGTRSQDGSIGRIKSGVFVIAAEANADIIPCRIIYKGGKMHLFGTCTVVFGKPIPAADLDLGTPRSAARLRACKERLAAEWETLLEENRQYQ